MASELIISVTDQETRVALVQHGVVVEMHVELARHLGIVGNIYKGHVLRVLPGMQAAFIDIGLERAAFLYVADIIGHFAHDDTRMMARQNELDNSEDEINNGDDDDLIEPQGSISSTVPIEELIHEGQELIVQVSKEPLGSKGARVSNHINLPGRYLVLMPTVEHVGVSRRIEDETERKRLKDIVEQNRPDPSMGFIVRTLAEGVDAETLKSDIGFLVGLYEQVKNKYKLSRAPSLIHSDLSITLRAMRDILNNDVERVVIDDPDEYEQILKFFGENRTGASTKIELYDGDEPIFDHFNIEIEISRALQRKVWLKSGGYIVIEQTEALTSIDVNTGRYVGKRNFEETILKTNLEAVKEICYQLRLRNIGGIIIIDFIDMNDEINREKVYNSLSDELKHDKARTNVLKFSELGLVEMTRKRTRENIVRALSEPCPYCERRGYIKSKSYVCSEIFRSLRRESRRIETPNLILQVHPEIADYLYEEERTSLEQMERRIAKRIIIKESPSLHIEQYEIYGTD